MISSNTFNPGISDQVHYPTSGLRERIADYIEDALLTGSKRLMELSSGLIYRRIELVRNENVFTKTKELLSEMSSVIEQVDPAMRAIPTRSGADDAPGDMREIRRACERVRTLINALVEWETEIYFIRPANSKYSRLFETLRGSVHGLFKELDKIPKGLRAGVEKARGSSGTGTHLVDLQLTLKSPPNLKAFNKEMKRLNGDFFWWF